MTASPEPSDARSAPDAALGGHERFAAIAVVAAACLVLLVGWRLFWFMTDDAYIAFRYAYNHMIGRGYVWNPEPFLPVEGYTSFLWVWLVEWVWRFTGIAPPRSSNWISLFFALGSLLLTVYMLHRLSWRPALPKQLMIGLCLLGVVSNRTFLAWSSSGLETAMFDFLLLAWCAVASRERARSPLAVLATSGLAALLYLTRPDGLLAVAASLAMIPLALSAASRSDRPRVAAAGMPLVAVPIHLLWRQSFYGQWLPNTYYAKHTVAWPESGLRYLASFLLEYAWWIWLVVLLAALIACGRALRRRLAEAPTGLLQWAAHDDVFLRRALVVATLLAHIGYYTFAIGGDHFEYRIYSHLVPLAFVSLAFALNRLSLGPVVCAGILGLQLLASWPIPWLHWQLSQSRQTRSETSAMFIPLADHFPVIMRGYVDAFDRLQAWLIDHYVCLRHQEHKVVGIWWLEQSLPSRTRGLEMSGEGLPVLFGAGGIGGLGWVLPRVHIIDGFGLNDWVVARARGEEREVRRMAHERKAPAEYVACLRPNVVPAPGGGFVVMPRDPPLRAEDVRACERRWRARVAGARVGGWEGGAD